MKPEPPPSADSVDSAFGNTLLVMCLLGVFILLGGVISGGAAVLGTFLGGARASAYDLNPVVDLLRFAVLSLIASTAIVLIWWRASGTLRPRFGIVPLLVVPLLALAIGFLLPDLRAQWSATRAARWHAHYETLRSDPGIALRERWFDPRNHEQHITFLKSIDDPAFHYAPALKDRLIKEDPFLRRFFEKPGSATFYADALSGEIPPQ